MKGQKENEVRESGEGKRIGKRGERSEVHVCQV